jgi:hypothetical protein
MPADGLLNTAFLRTGPSSSHAMPAGSSSARLGRSLRGLDHGRVTRLELGDEGQVEIANPPGGVDEDGRPGTGRAEGEFAVMCLQPLSRRHRLSRTIRPGIVPPPIRWLQTPRPGGRRERSRLILV